MRTTLIAFILFAGSFSTAQAETLRLRDGRQYTFELARRLGVELPLLMDVYLNNRANLPADKDFSLLAAGIQPMAKLAAAACSVATDLSPEHTSYADLNQLYQMLLFRPATQAELREALRDDEGRISYFNNCVQIAISPDLLFINDNYLGNQPGLEVPVYGRH